MRNGAAYVTGYTNSTRFPNVHGLQDCIENTPSPSGEPGTAERDGCDVIFTGPRDIFVAKLNPAGDDLVFSTFIGGLEYDYGRAIAVDDGGTVYVTGSSEAGTNFPVVGASIVADGKGMFFAVLSIPDGAPETASLDYATHLSGDGFALTADAGGRVYLGGRTGAGLGFLPLPPFNATSAGQRQEGFVASLVADSPAMDGWQADYWALLRGSEDEQVIALARGAGEALYAGGFTTSTDFNTGDTSGPQTGAFSGSENFLVRLNASPPPPQIDLDVSKTLLTPDPAELGETVEFEITVTNTGEIDATNIVVTDVPVFATPLPSAPLGGSEPPGCTVAGNQVECTQLDDLAPGESASVVIALEAAELGTLANQATASADQPDADQSNNTDAAAVEIVAPPPALVVTKTITDLDLDSGTVTWVIEVVNDSPTAATGVTLEDELPPAVQDVTFLVPGAPQCESPGSPGAIIVACNLNTITETIGAAVVIEVAFNPVSSGGGLICNTAEVNAANAPTVSSEPACFNPSLAADVVVEKLFEVDDVTGEVTMTILLENQGAGPAFDVVVVDTLPVGVELAQPLLSACSPVAGANAVECGPYQMPAGDTEFAQLEGQLTDLPPGTEELCNALDVTVNGVALPPIDPFCIEAPQPNLVVELVNAPAEATYLEFFPESVMAFVTNDSIVSAHAVEFVVAAAPDKLIEIQAGDATHGPCDFIGTQAVGCDIAILGPGEEALLLLFPVLATGIDDATGMSVVTFTATATTSDQSGSDARDIAILGVETDLSMTIDEPIESPGGAETTITVNVMAAPEPAPFFRLRLDVLMSSPDFGVDDATIRREGGADTGCTVTPTGTVLTTIECQITDLSEGRATVRLAAPLDELSIVWGRISGFVKEPAGAAINNTANWPPFAPMPP